MLAANRTTLTAQAQQNELHSIIGLIKRSQMSHGALLAFSGGNTVHRTQAVLDMGGWHAEQPTEDVAIAGSCRPPAGFVRATSASFWTFRATGSDGNRVNLYVRSPTKPGPASCR